MFAEGKSCKAQNSRVRETLCDQSIFSLAGRKTIEESLVHRKKENEDAGWSVDSSTAAERGPDKTSGCKRQQLEGK